MTIGDVGRAVLRIMRIYFARYPSNSTYSGFIGTWARFPVKPRPKRRRKRRK